MTSGFAWLDYDERARQRMREIVGQFEESGSIDELGLGRIRDAFSDRFFPGTSVLWRRARYLLFVPWMYRGMEQHGFRPQTATEASKATQARIRDALKSGEDTDGLIGARAKYPVAPPDTILWRGLELWGLRSPTAGSLAEYRSSIPRRPLAAHHETELAGGMTIWNDRLPAAPDDFPDAASFALRRHEAEFLRDIVLTEPEDSDLLNDPTPRHDSLLAAMLDRGGADAAVPWDHPRAEADDDLGRGLRFARGFSRLMQGARLLYVLQLARARREIDTEAEISEAMGHWADGLDSEEVVDWDANLDEFFIYARRINHRISHTEEAFVRGWSKVVLAGLTSVAQSEAAIHLVTERERLVKGGKARLTAAQDRPREDGGAIPGLLTYRWNNGRQIARDILDGLAA